ncbi:MAG: hypothetical protein M3Y54_03020 [Bacteroidota bacterium]|nr:hypothetical protein [Bacteroidota bacterium]
MRKPKALFLGWLLAGVLLLSLGWWLNGQPGEQATAKWLSLAGGLLALVPVARLLGRLGRSSRPAPMD